MQNPHLEGDPFFWKGGPVGVLLLHGFTATTAEVRPLAQVLHAQGHTVAGALLPGHGTTPEELNRCHRRDWVQAAETAYQQITTHCERVFVGGESTGSLLTLHLASEHPEITGVLSYAPFLRMRSRTLPRLAPLLAPFVGAFPKRKGTPSPADGRWQGYTVYPVRAAVQLFRLQRQARHRLYRIRQPLLIVHGRLDQTVDPLAPETLYQAVNSLVKELHWLENSGHCVILDGEWEQAAELTLQFIQRVLDGVPEPGDNP